MTVFTTLRGMTLEDFDKIKHIPFDIFCIHLPDVDGMTKIPVNDVYLELLEKCINTFDYSFFAYGTIRDEVINVIKNYDQSKIFWNQSIHSRAGNLDGVAPRERLSGHIACGDWDGQCKSALNRNILLPNGDVALCCMDFGLKHIIGNLLTDEYTDLFRSDEYNKVVAGMYVDSMDSMCRICDYAIPRPT